MLVLGGLPHSTRAQAFYTYPGAPVVARGHLVSGGYLAAGENDLLRLGGYGRFGLTRYVDFGLEFVLDTANGNARAGAGADLKLRLLPENRALPFDLSASYALGFVSGDGVRILQAPVGGILSMPMELDNGQVLTPYLAVYLLIVNSEIDRPNGTTISDTDFDAEIRPGISVQIDPNFELFGAVHLGRDALFAIGANFHM